MTQRKKSIFFFLSMDSKTFSASEALINEQELVALSHLTVNAFNPEFHHLLDSRLRCLVSNCAPVQLQFNSYFLRGQHVKLPSHLCIDGACLKMA